MRSIDSVTDTFRISFLHTTFSFNKNTQKQINGCDVDGRPGSLVVLYQPICRNLTRLKAIACYSLKFVFILRSVAHAKHVQGTRLSSAKCIIIDPPLRPLALMFN